jgi:formylglycine-generating enzyme required for sulfatase activity
MLAWLLACGGAPTSPSGAGPTADDADGDGLTDADEARVGSDPANPDSDGDGKTDGVEVHKHKTDPTKMDTDGDGAPDGAELAGNTDPLVPNPEFMPDDPTPPAPDRLDGQPKEPTRNLSPDEALPKEWRCGPGAYEGCFLFVAQGQFAMGAQAKDPAARGHDPAAQPEEGPVHDVTVGPLWMMRLEFPAALWDRCVELRWCDAAEAAAGTSLFNAGMTRPGHPINGVTWAGAAKACDWLGGRLPTEAEWEYAARGAEGRRWPWGPLKQCGVMPFRSNSDGSGLTLDDGQEFDECANDGTANSGRLRGTSPFGVLGMAGNVWEWTADWYAPDAYATHAPVRPTGPATGTARVQRGGGWTSLDPLDLRSAARGSMKADQKMHDVGFRCVRDVKGDAP